MVLSICLAIYKRLPPFVYTFERLLDQVRCLEDVEIIVSVNPSEDGNTDLIDYVKGEKISNDFCLYINDVNIGGEANIINAVSHANGRYVWIIGDDDLVLPGVVSEVLNILKCNQDVTWLFMNTARISGKIEENNKDLIIPKVADFKEGYYKDGIKCALKMHKLVDAALLFSSSNVYLRESMLEIYNLQQDESDCNQIASAFLSASQGAAYLIDKPCILAGGVRTWTDREDYFLGVHYNRDIMLAINHGITKKQAKSLIAYRMRHDAMRSWFAIFKMIIKKNELGKIAYGELLSLMPVETILCSILSPLMAVYLLVRHRIRNIDRKKRCRDYKNNPNAIIEIKERIPDNI